MNPYLSPARRACFDGEQADPPKSFTQADIDRIVQKRVGKLERQISELHTKAGQDAAFIDELKAARETERAEWEATSAAQTAELQAQLTERDDTIARITNERDNMTIATAIDAAARDADAVSPQLLSELLAPKTSIVDGKPVVKMGEYVLSPAEAVIYLKAQPEKYGSLFRSNVVGGVGASGAPAGTPAKSVDVKKLSPEDYRRIKAENPRQLGFNS